MRMNQRAWSINALLSLAVVLLVGTSLAQPAPSASPAVSGTPAGAESSVPPASTTVAAPAPSGSSPSSSTPDMDGSTYAVRLRDLEQRIDELKEQIRRSHTRLSLLSDTILGGSAAGSRATIMFENEMSGAFRLVRAVFVLDGAVQYNKVDETGALSTQKSVPIYNGSIPPGDHVMQVVLGLQGHGYGVFSYLRGYKFQVNSSHSFTVTEGKQVNLRVISYEKGGVTTPLEQRPAVRYLESVNDVNVDEAAAPAATSSDSSVKGSLQVGGGAK